ncbi:MAG: SDR family oxidoreductase [Caldilineaceae bacterium]|nr:SDR family oxidoreductase [Caldilineaceae bacterium]
MSGILVTGATGNVGGEVAKLLAAAGADVRAGVRQPQKWSGSGDPVAFDFLDAATHRAALDCVDKLFLVRPPALAKPEHDIVPFVDGAVASGVEQIVFLSLLGVENNPFVPHRKIEAHIRLTGVPYTFLRAGFFMQNLNTAQLADICDHDEIFVPAGNGKTSFIDVRDIAAVGVKALTEPGHAYCAYPLTGDEALTYGQVAAQMTEVLGRPIRYPNPSPLAFIQRWRKRDETLSFILVMTALYTVTRLGRAGLVTEDLRRLLGRPAISMRQYIEEYQAFWTR